jgi:hypothetical protein
VGVVVQKVVPPLLQEEATLAVGAVQAMHLALNQKTAVQAS